MTRTHPLTIHLPTFETEILRRAAAFQDITPEQLVVKQLNLENLRELFDYVISNGSQGYMGRLETKRCTRCRLEYLLGEGAQMCHNCEHGFPERCPDEVHEQFASMWQSEPGANFHCGTCNAWVIVSEHQTTQTDSAKPATTPNKQEPTYTVALGYQPYEAVNSLLKGTILRQQRSFAERVSSHLDLTYRSIVGISKDDLNKLEAMLVKVIARLEDRLTDTESQTRHRDAQMLQALRAAVKAIKYAVRRQDRAQTPVTQ